MPTTNANAGEIRATGGRRWRHRVIGAVAVTAAAALAVPAGAQAVNLYWDNDTRQGATPFTIGRANADGSGANVNFITGQSDVDGVAVTRTHIYWANSTADTIGRAKRDGSEVNASFITGAVDPIAVAVNGSYVFWTNFGDDTIGRANLDGTAVNQSLIAGADDPVGIAANDNYVFWANDGLDTVARASVDGSSANQSWLDTAWSPFGVALFGGHVYWSAGGSRIGRAKTDGSQQDLYFITGLQSAVGVAVGEEGIFWGDQTSDAIGHATLNGKTVDLLFLHEQVGDTGWVALSPIALAQTPARRCVTAPRGLPVRGHVRLMMAHCRTNADQVVGAKVSAKNKGVGLFCKLSRNRRAKIKRSAQGAYCSSGELMLRTMGRRGPVSVIWDAASTDDYKPYWAKRNYRV